MFAVKPNDYVNLDDLLANLTNALNFLANAICKAKYYAKHTNEITFSDDSVFCVTALNGAPGVYSKDFITENGGTIQACARIEKKLEHTSHRSAYMHNAGAIYFPKNDCLRTNEAQVHGTIVFPPRGSGLMAVRKYLG